MEFQRSSEGITQREFLDLLNSPISEDVSKGSFLDKFSKMSNDLKTIKKSLKEQEDVNKNLDESIKKSLKENEDMKKKLDESMKKLKEKQEINQRLENINQRLQEIKFKTLFILAILAIFLYMMFH